MMGGWLVQLRKGCFQRIVHRSLQVVASGEGLTAGAINDYFVGRVRNEKMVKLEMGITSFHH
eukprot:11652102-Ditylum_brightwellii.AAC.1